MKKLIALACTALLISGCATVTDTYGPNGKKAYALNCSGSGRGWDKCEAAAGDICKDKGYKIISKNTEDSSIAQGSTSFFALEKSNERSMTIQCR